MAIDKDLILKLRDASHAGFSDCKKALEENNNDLEASIKWLRSKGIAKATNKNALKEAKEGGTWVKKNSEGVAIIEMNSETDFTANSREFSDLANSIVDVVLENKVSYLDKVNALKMGNGYTVSDNCLHLSSITGEKIVLTRVKYLPISSSESAACYRHNNGKMSAVVLFDKKLDDKDISGFAVHYAANNPKFITVDEVDKAWIDSEREIITSLLEKENKPKEFHERIITERIKKLVSQDTFLEQSYLYDNSKTIKQKLEELGANIKGAVYFGLGVSS